jgi:iron uptake system component EfeO
MLLRPAHATTLAAALAASVLLAGCGGSDGDPTAKEASDTGGSSGNEATVTVTAKDGCSIDRTSFPAGGIHFNVKNVDATAVTEVEVLSGSRIVGEKENLPPGFSGTFSITASAGDYTLYCPGAGDDKTTLKVTGTGGTSNADADTTTLLEQATEGYAEYVRAQVGYLVSTTTELDKALHGKNLRAAQVAYAKARPFYEKIEPVAESFSVGKVSLDANIDARENDVPAGEFRGFHRIEKGLFQAKSMRGLAAYGDRLVSDVTQLRTLVAKLEFQPAELANGAQELLDEVAGSKITGEEERYSHLDVLDIAYNVEGSQQAFVQLAPALKKIDPTLAEKISARFDALNTLVQKYRRPSSPYGFVLYDQLGAADRRALAAAVKDVQEPLSQVASKVA